MVLDTCLLKDYILRGLDIAITRSLIESIWQTRFAGQNPFNYLETRQPDVSLCFQTDRAC